MLRKSSDPSGSTDTSLTQVAKRNNHSKNSSSVCELSTKERIMKLQRAMTQSTRSQKSLREWDKNVMKLDRRNESTMNTFKSRKKLLKLLAEEKKMARQKKKASRTHVIKKQVQQKSTSSPRRSSKPSLLVCRSQHSQLLNSRCLSLFKELATLREVEQSKHLYCQEPEELMTTTICSQQIHEMETTKPSFAMAESDFTTASNERHISSPPQEQDILFVPFDRFLL